MEILKKYPEIKVVFEQTANWDRAQALSLMENPLQTGKQIDAGLRMAARVQLHGPAALGVHAPDFEQEAGLEGGPLSGVGGVPLRTLAKVACRASGLAKVANGMTRCRGRRHGSRGRGRRRDAGRGR